VIPVIPFFKVSWHSAEKSGYQGKGRKFIEALANTGFARYPLICWRLAGLAKLESPPLRQIISLLDSMHYDDILPIIS
jgi:hypothetical protein